MMCAESRRLFSGSFNLKKALISSSGDLIGRRAWEFLDNHVTIWSSNNTVQKEKEA